jgi:hypothetical protein
MAPFFNPNGLYELGSFLLGNPFIIEVAHLVFWYAGCYASQFDVGDGE